jgi:hypothetical protein
MPWDTDAIAKLLSEWVDVQGVMDSLPFATYAPSFAPTPFHVGIEALQSAWPVSPFRAEVMLNAWTIDDAGWLAEAVCLSCRRGGVTDDIAVAVRLVA